MKPTITLLLLGAALSFAPALLAAPAVAADMGYTPEVSGAALSLIDASAIPPAVDAAVSSFYARRGNAPLWLDHGQPRAAVTSLVSILRRAPLDGLSAGPMLADQIQASMSSASANPVAAMRAEKLMSSSWLMYVEALHTPVPGMTYVDPQQAPRAPAAGWVLEQAARSSSLGDHLAQVSAVNPLYAQLRDAVLAQGAVADTRIVANLQRLRGLPASGRFILVDAATQHLSMVENGRIVDGMKVVVGRPDAPTPMVASTIWYATFNPYWNIPSDLGRKLIAPHVVKEGTGWLKKNGYEVIADWDTPTTLPATSVNWRGVMAGTTEVKLRELPGSDNSMGVVKFGFGNPQGIYLHDTNNKALFVKDERTLSNGCVRLEDAKKLGAWLMGAPLAAPSDQPELNVRLPEGVPVYITYLTAHADNGSLAFTDDVYGRDGGADRLAAR